MKEFIDNYFKLLIVIFLIWISICAYKMSQNGRYQFKQDSHFIIDTQSGDLYINRGNGIEKFGD